MQVDRVSKVLSGKLGRPPSVAEIAETIEASQEDVLEAMEAAQAYDAVSLDAPRATGEAEADPFGESLGADDERFDLVEYGAAIAGPLARLPPRDRIVLHLRFSEDMTQSEIAARIGVSQMQVSRLIRRALAKLREDVGEPAEE